LQGLRVEQAKDALEGVVGGDAAGQAQEAPEPTRTLLGEEGDVGPVIAVGNDTAQGHDEQVDEQMFGAASDAGVVQGSEVLLDRGHGRGSSHALLRGRANLRRILWLYTCPKQPRRNNSRGV